MNESAHEAASAGCCVWCRGYVPEAPGTINAALADQYRWGEPDVPAARPDVEYAVRYLGVFVRLLRSMTRDDLAAAFECEDFRHDEISPAGLASRIEWITSGLADRIQAASN